MSGKIFYDVELLNDRLEELPGKTIVFTNGVFDLLHAGHIELLEFAKANGDILVLGINDDASVKRLKGDERPVYPLEERMEILEAMQMVDFVIPFTEDTPLRLITSLLRVDVLVKGGDYLPLQVVGREEVEQSGGKLLLFQFKTDASTTDLVGKIRKKPI